MGDLSTQDEKKVASLNSPETRRLTLLPARPDFKSPQMQMSAGAIAALLLCFVIYGSTWNTGFLLDDFLHINYVAAALHGDWSGFLANFTGNWAGSDLMKSYRPLSSLSLFVDGALSGLNPVFFHLSNILLYGGCSYLTGLIALEMSGFRGNRLGASAAVWAACLFAVYPLHAESVAWIIGRVDLLCTFFYLLSIFAYLRFRVIRETWYFHLSLGSFICALLCKEMAVTLPAVIIMAEVLLFGAEDKALPKDVRDNRLVQRVSYIMAFFFILSFMAGMRLLILGTLVGGYSSEGSSGINLSNLRDRASLLKIIFPVHEEMQLQSWICPLLNFGYISALVVFCARILARSIQPGVILFLLGWIVVAVLPTFQIWHIWPNLVGSRLFFTSSVPFCILISLVALPAIDIIRKKFAIPLTIAGTISLGSMFLAWTALSQMSVSPWVKAGAQVNVLRHQVKQELASIAEGDHILFLNLPTDYSGAGMITREQYLKLTVQPPFVEKDFSPAVETIEPVVAGSHELMWPNRFRSISSDKHTAKVLIWSNKDTMFVPYQQPKGNKAYRFNFEPEALQKLTFEPQDMHPEPANGWKNTDEKYSVMEYGNDFLRLRPGKRRISIKLPQPVGVSPTACDLMSVQLVSTKPERLVDKISVVWKAAGAETEHRMPLHPVTQSPLLSPGIVTPGSPPAALASPEAPALYRTWLGRHRDWTLSNDISSMALCFEPGDYEVVLKSVELSSSESFLPQLHCDQMQETAKGTSKQSTLLPTAVPVLRYDCSKVPGATSCKLLVTAANHTFDANFIGESDAELTTASGKKPLVEIPLATITGTLPLPRQLLAAPGIYQLRAVALGPGKTLVGLPGEPLTVEIMKNERSQADIRIDP